MVSYNTVEEYHQLMMEAHLEYLSWLDESRRQRKSDKVKFAKVRRATLSARRKAAREAEQV
jgi:hypothetical protein